MLVRSALFASSFRNYTASGGNHRKTLDKKIKIFFSSEVRRNYLENNASVTCENNFLTTVLKKLYFFVPVNENGGHIIAHIIAHNSSYLLI